MTGWYIVNIKIIIVILLSELLNNKYCRHTWFTDLFYFFVDEKILYRKYLKKNLILIR